MKSKDFFHAVLVIRPYKNGLVAGVGNTLVFVNQEIKVVDTWRDIHDEIQDINVCQDEILTISFNLYVKYWKRENVLWTIHPFPIDTRSIHFHAKKILVCDSWSMSNYKVYSLELDNGQLTKEKEIRQPGRFCLFSNEFMLTYFESNLEFSQNEIFCWTIRWTLQTYFGTPHSFSVSTFLVAICDYHHIDFRDRQTGQLIYSTGVPSLLFCICFVSESTLAFGQNCIDTIQLWEADTHWITFAPLRRHVQFKLLFMKKNK